MEACLRSLESLKIIEDDPNSSVEQDPVRIFDALTAKDNLGRIPLHYAMKYGFSYIQTITV